MNKTIDLHTHTTASDGTYTPSELITLAKEIGLSAVAITDHDTVDGVDEGLKEAEKLGIELVTGVELSAVPPSGGTLHILGYCFDHKNTELVATLARLVSLRNQRNQRIIEKFHDIDVDISLDEVEALAGGDVIGRPHFAKVLLKKGYVNTVQDAFNIYLGKGGKCYLDKERLTIEESVRLITGAGGIPVLAHPFTLGLSNSELKKYVSLLRDAGVRGIEVFYPEHNYDRTVFYKEMANELDLVVTGGTDFHGKNKENTRLGMGKVGNKPLKIPYECLENIKSALPV